MRKQRAITPSQITGEDLRFLAGEASGERVKEVTMSVVPDLACREAVCF